MKKDLIQVHKYISNIIIDVHLIIEYYSTNAEEKLVCIYK